MSLHIKSFPVHHIPVQTLLPIEKTFHRFSVALSCAQIPPSITSAKFLSLASIHLSSHMSSYRLPTTSCIAFACANPETNSCLDKDSCWNEKWFKRCQRRRNVNVSFFIIHRKTHLSFRPRNSRPLFFSASIHPWHIRVLLCYSLKRYFIHWYLLWWWKKTWDFAGVRLSPVCSLAFVKAFCMEKWYENGSGMSWNCICDVNCHWENAME